MSHALPLPLAEPPAEPPDRRVLGLPPAVWPRLLAPLLLGCLAMIAWEAWVRLRGIPSFLLPPPPMIPRLLVANWHLPAGPPG
ncbi:MAG: hypothetical protein KA795_05370, partial [Burkholderiaceae bacterium]|nr:hypothetical protein [Burkholderiaceae bacterium]